MIDRRDKLLSKTGEDIRNRYNMDGFMTKAEYYANMSNNKALKVSFGGTGQTSFAKGSYLVGNGSENIGEYSSLEVRQDLGIIIPEDHITEKGVSGQWEYTKWQSGKIELNAVLSANVSTSDLWASGIYYGSASFDLPEVFSAAEDIFSLVSPASVVLCWVCGSVASASALTIYIARPVNAASDFYFNVYISGYIS